MTDQSRPQKENLQSGEHLLAVWSIAFYTFRYFLLRNRWERDIGVAIGCSGSLFSPLFVVVEVRRARGRSFRGFLLCVVSGPYFLVRIGADSDWHTVGYRCEVPKIAPIQVVLASYFHFRGRAM